MKKKWILILPVLLYVFCLALINSSFQTLFAMQGEIGPELFEQIQKAQQIMTIGKSASLFLVLIGLVLFGYTGLKENKMKWLNVGLGVVIVEILYAILFSKLCTGMWLVYAEQYQFSKWFWIVLFVIWISFFITIKRKRTS